MTTTEFTRFQSRALPDDNGCHIWQGYTTPCGYGQVRVGGKTMFAHRAAYEHFKGAIPAGNVIRHKCNVRTCVCPDHLESGTHAENMRDMAQSGRHFSKTNPEKITKGSQHGMAKLDEHRVREIRGRYGSGSSTVVAADFGVTASLVRMIWRREIWAHV